MQAEECLRSPASPTSLSLLTSLLHPPFFLTRPQFSSDLKAEMWPINTTAGFPRTWVVEEGNAEPERSHIATQ